MPWSLKFILWSFVTGDFLSTQMYNVHRIHVVSAFTAFRFSSTFTVLFSKSMEHVLALGWWQQKMKWEPRHALMFLCCPSGFVSIYYVPCPQVGCFLPLSFLLLFAPFLSSQHPSLRRGDWPIPGERVPAFFTTLLESKVLPSVALKVSPFLVAFD